MTATALPIMDVQQGMVERFARDGGYLDRLATAIAAARSVGDAVVPTSLSGIATYRAPSTAGQPPRR